MQNPFYTLSLPVEEDLIKTWFWLEVRYVWNEGFWKMEMLIEPGQYWVWELNELIRRKA